MPSGSHPLGGRDDTENDVVDVRLERGRRDRSSGCVHVSRKQNVGHLDRRIARREPGRKPEDEIRGDHVGDSGVGIIDLDLHLSEDGSRSLGPGTDRGLRRKTNLLVGRGVGANEILIPARLREFDEGACRAGVIGNGHCDTLSLLVDLIDLFLGDSRCRTNCPIEGQGR